MKLTWVSCVRENFMHSSYGGGGWKTDRARRRYGASPFTRQLFFKALKQTAKVKSFLGTSANAVGDADMDGVDRHES